MQILNSYITNTRVSNGLEPVSANNETFTNTTRATLPDSAALNDIPLNQPTFVDEHVTIKYEVNELLQQFYEWIRVSSESRRMETLYNVLFRESQGSSELFGKIMDIARRIMRNEDVSAEEIQFLMEHNPRLLYVVTVIKDESSGDDGKERRRARDRRGKDRRSASRRRDHFYTGNQSSETAGIILSERKNPAIPHELAKQINSLLVKTSMKKIYEATRKKKNHLSISVNTIITSTQDTAR